MLASTFRRVVFRPGACEKFSNLRFEASILATQLVQPNSQITDRDADRPTQSNSLLHGSIRQTLQFCTTSHSADDTSTSSSASGTQQSTPDIKHLLLAGGLKHVARYGWSTDALNQSAIDQGLSPAVVGILPRGEAELVEHFIQSCNERLKEQLDNMGDEFSSLPTTKKVQTAVKIRLEMLIPYIDSWPKALSIAAHPSNAPSSLQHLYDLVNIIWLAAGDRSTDTNWYTKRLLLAGVYTSTELYMLTDFSPGYSDTWDALERRLQDVVTVGKQTREIGVLAGAATQQFGSMLMGLLRVVDQKGTKAESKASQAKESAGGQATDAAAGAAGAEVAAGVAAGEASAGEGAKTTRQG